MKHKFNIGDIVKYKESDNSISFIGIVISFTNATSSTRLIYQTYCLYDDIFYDFIQPYYEEDLDNLND